MWRACFLLSLGVVSTAWAGDIMYPVPPNAIEVGHDVLVPGTYEEDRFFLVEDYPGTSALEHYRKVFATWHLCTGSTTTWESFPDAAGREPAFVHQLIRHWVNPRNDSIITLVLMYSSSGLAERQTPATNRQFVAITRQRHVAARQEMEKRGIKCADGTQQQWSGP